MLGNGMQSVLRYIHRTLEKSGTSGLTDSQLLERYTCERDEASFELVVLRHGSMVWNVCRRVLLREQDVEDAFQATFLTFALKANTIGRAAALASWLYKVAYRIALEARARRSRTALREGQLVHEPARTDSAEWLWNDVRPLLDSEISGLPEKYRRAFVLCYLEGKTNAEAATELGCSLGTIFSRLAWARERMRNRLTRRGVTLSAGGLGLLLSRHAAAAVLPAKLVASTVQASMAIITSKAAIPLVSAPVLGLMRWATTAMLMTKLKLAGAITVGLTTVAVGIFLTNPGQSFLRSTQELNPALDPPVAITAAPAPSSALTLRLPVAKHSEDEREQFSALSARSTASPLGEILVASTVANHATATPLTWQWASATATARGELPGAYQADGKWRPALRTQLWNTYGTVEKGEGSIALFANPKAQHEPNTGAVNLVGLLGMALGSGRHDLMAAYSVLQQTPHSVLRCSRWESASVRNPATPGLPLTGKLLEGDENGLALIAFVSTIAADERGRYHYRYRVEHAGDSPLQFRWAGFSGTLEPGESFERSISSADLTEEVAANATVTRASGVQEFIVAHFWKPPS